jgi:hypothetical protein
LYRWIKSSDHQWLLCFSSGFVWVLSLFSL